MTARDRMVAALMDFVIPQLKTQGFRGTFPNYRKLTPTCVQLISFQFSGLDQSFCVNLAKCPRQGLDFRLGEYLAPEKVTALHCPHKLILGAQNGYIYHWYKYNPRPHELKRQAQYPFLTMYKDTPLKYVHIAQEVLQTLKEEGSQYWEAEPDWWDGGDLPEFNGLLFSIQEGINNLVLQ